MVRRSLASLLVVAGLALAVPSFAAAAPNTLKWNLSNGNGNVDYDFIYGMPGDIPITGDWNGDGKDTPGVVRGNVWYLSNGNGNVDAWFGYGNPGDIPVVGDWNGDGKDTPGVVRGTTWYLTNGYGSTVDYVFSLGNPGDVPVVGDWNGDGYDSPGVFRGGWWYLSNGLGNAIDYAFDYGGYWGTPFAGNWDGPTGDSPGLFNGGNSWWYLSNLVGYNASPTIFNYGLAGDWPLRGDWDGDGRDTIGIARNWESPPPAPTDFEPGPTSFSVGTTLDLDARDRATLGETSNDDRLAARAAAAGHPERGCRLTHDTSSWKTPKLPVVGSGQAVGVSMDTRFCWNKRKRKAVWDGQVMRVDVDIAIPLQPLINVIVQPDKVAYNSPYDGSNNGSVLMERDLDMQVCPPPPVPVFLGCTTVRRIRYWTIGYDDGSANGAWYDR